jgi:hypothetical protein
MAKATCVHCGNEVYHLWHWYDECTCSAAGGVESHSDHCDLAEYELVYDDTLLGVPDDDE